MTRHQWAPIIILLSTVFAQSCKDEIDLKPGGEITYEGKTIRLIAGLIDPDPTPNELIDGEVLYVHRVVLLSEGLSYDNEGLHGKGDVVQLRFSTNSEDVIPSGTYAYSPVDQNFDVENLVFLGASPEEGTQEKIYSAEAGTIKVSRSGKVYTFTFDQAVHSNAFLGTYKGALADYSF